MPFQNQIFAFDHIVTTVSRSGATIESRRSKNGVGISVYFLATSPNFFLNVSSNYFPLEATPLFTSNNSERNVLRSIDYTSKSNFTNGQVILTTVGVNFTKGNDLDSFSVNVAVVQKAQTYFDIRISVPESIRLRFLRVCSISYEIVNDVAQHPFYINSGSLTLFGDEIDDISENQDITNLGVIFSGLNSWSSLSDDFSYKITFERNQF